VTSASLDPHPPQPHRRAPPVGRALRVLLGLVLLVQVVPAYFRVDLSVAAGALLLILVLIGLYMLIHVMLSQRASRMSTNLGAVVAAGILVALYLAGGRGSLIFGRGEGALASVTFLSLSLVVAGVRADPGCEVMSIPAIFLRKHTDVACLIFSPFDRLERTLRRRRAV
jgi:hypothetical protein